MILLCMNIVFAYTQNLVRFKSIFPVFPLLYVQTGSTSWK